MQMIDSVPRISMYGENHGLLKLIHDQLSEGLDASIDAFHHDTIDSTRLKKATQEFLLEMMGHKDNDNIFVGFKQLTKRIPDLELVHEMFPCAKYIINYRRNLSSQVEAHIREEMNPELMGPNFKENTRKFLANETDYLMRFYKKHEAKSFLLPLEDYSLDRFNQMLAFLGVSGCQFHQIARDNTGADGWGLDRRTIDVSAMLAKSESGVEYVTGIKSYALQSSNCRFDITL